MAAIVKSFMAARHAFAKSITRDLYVKHILAHALSHATTTANAATTLKLKPMAAHACQHSPVQIAH